MNNKYIIVNATCSHNLIEIVQASSIESAIENYCKYMYSTSRKLKDGRIVWEDEYYNNYKELLASNVDLSVEFQKFSYSGLEKVEEIFCGIDWTELYHQWDSKNFYMHNKIKVSDCYEWYYEKFDYYTLFKNPEYIEKRFREMFQKTT